MITVVRVLLALLLLPLVAACGTRLQAAGQGGAQLPLGEEDAMPSAMIPSSPLPTAPPAAGEPDAVPDLSGVVYWTSDGRGLLVETFDLSDGKPRRRLVDVETGQTLVLPLPERCRVVGWIGGSWERLPGANLGG